MDFSQKMMLVPHSRARGLSDPKQKTFRNMASQAFQRYLI